MFKGFYQLTSAMLSQGRRLDVVSHNMTNISTAGYKLDRYTDSTFQDVLISRVGNKNKAVSTEMGEETYILAPSELVTDFTQGSMEETTLPLDLPSSATAFSPSTGTGMWPTPAMGASTWTTRGICASGDRGGS